MKISNEPIEPHQDYQFQGGERIFSYKFICWYERFVMIKIQRVWLKNAN